MSAKGMIPRRRVVGTPLTVGLSLKDQPAAAAQQVSPCVTNESRTGDEMGGLGTVKGVHLGGVGIWGDDGSTSSESATSLTGSTAGTGATRSALGVGRRVGGPRGVVVVEVLPSMVTDFAAKGEGTKEFSCPLASERGGTEIQTLSFSLGIMMG